MARKYFDLVRVATSTTGTGTLTLGSAITGFLTFALGGVANADTVTYGIWDRINGASEFGEGTYTSAGTTLARNTVFASSNGGAKIVCSASCEVFLGFAKEDIALLATLADPTFSGVLTVTANATTLPADIPGFGSRIHIGGADGGNATLLIDAFANGVTSAPNVMLRVSEGTAAAPTACAVSQIMGQFGWIGYQGGYQTDPKSFIRVSSMENWTSSARGTQMIFAITPVGSIVTQAAMTVGGAGGGVTVGAAGDQGLGTLNVLNGYYDNGTALAGNLPATATNDNANSGKVGEFASSVVAFGSRVTSNGTAVDVTTLSLTAGDWEVSGHVQFYWVGGTGTATFVEGAISTVAAQLNDNTVSTAYAGFEVPNPTTSLFEALSIGSCRMSLASTTTVHLSAKISGLSAGGGVYGTIRARRVR